jgi:hypothetical protein
MVFRGYGSPTPEEEKRAIGANSLKTPERTVRIWDVAEGKIRTTLPTNANYPLPLAFVSNEVCAALSPSHIQFWNISQPKLQAQLTILSIKPNKEGFKMEWMASTPEGAYDFSEGAAAYLRWNVDGKVQTAPPATLLRKPGLLQNVLKSALEAG